MTSVAAQALSSTTSHAVKGILKVVIRLQTWSENRKQQLPTMMRPTYRC